MGGGETTVAGGEVRGGRGVRSRAVVGAGGAGCTDAMGGDGTASGRFVGATVAVVGADGTGTLPASGESATTPEAAGTTTVDVRERIQKRAPIAPASISTAPTRAPTARR